MFHLCRGATAGTKQRGEKRRPNLRGDVGQACHARLADPSSVVTRWTVQDDWDDRPDFDSIRVPDIWLDRIVNEPDWTKSARFDVEAIVANPEALDSDLKRTQALRELLAQRFHLRTHQEQWTVSVYCD
jgi:hypothetical protein